MPSHFLMTDMKIFDIRVFILFTSIKKQYLTYHYYFLNILNFKSIIYFRIAAK